MCNLTVKKSEYMFFSFLVSFREIIFSFNELHTYGPLKFIPSNQGEDLHQTLLRNKSPQRCIIFDD